MLYFLYFIIYSFIGFILETIYFLFTKGHFISRKCFLLSPLCPVYGLGAIAILLATKYIKKYKIVSILIGGIIASIVEFLFHYIYKDILGVTIWDYSNLSFNLNGRICLLYSLFWCFLAGVLIYFIHPYIEKKIPSIPRSIFLTMLVLFGIDSILSIILYKHFGNKDAINLFWLKTNYNYLKIL